MLTLERTKDRSVAVDSELGLMQLKIDPASKEVTTKSFRKVKMASSRAKKNKKHRVIRSKSTDNTRIVELRKERSRDAARTRRGKENAQFDELAKLLPLPNAIASQLDKASIVRLTISYLDMKQFVRRARRERQASDTSIFSESSTSPMSECGTDGANGSPGSCSPNSSISSPPVSTGAVVPYQQADSVNHGDFATESALYLLQALDGFLFVLSNEGKVLYVSETVSVHLGLSQVELTGSSMYTYLHPDDQDDLTKVLDEATREIENASHPTTSGLFDNNIPFFGQQQPFARGHTSPSQERPKSFFLRMKCTLVRRGGAYTKSSGFKVIHCMGRMKKYSYNDLTPAKFAFVAMGQPLPTMNINELPLECDMFVSRVNMDLTIVYCEGRIHKFMDYFARDIVGISAYDFYHGSDVAVIQSHHAKFLSKGQVLTKYYRWMNKNGGWVWMQTKASLIPHPTNPELKQMLCLNYILSDVEHRGVVLGMAQLDDKPSFNRSGAYITEVENESDSSGNNFKDAQYDNEVMVYPKWLQTADKLVPKPTLLDTLALNRTGYSLDSNGLDASVLDNDVFSTTSSQLPQTSTSLTTTASSGSSTGVMATTSGSTSTLEDDLDDIAEIIDADMTELDREFAAYVLSGTEIPLTTQPAQKSSRVAAENFATITPPSNKHVQTGSPFGEPKIEQVPMEVLENTTLLGPPESTCRVKGPEISSQTFGSLPLEGLCSDTKAGLLSMNQEGELLQLTFTTESSKLRGTSGACMYSNTRVNSGGRETTVTNNTNLLKMPSTIPPRNVAYSSHNQSYRISEATSAVNSSVPGNFNSPTENLNTARGNKEQIRFLNQLKASFVPEKSFSDDILVDLVDEMMQDRAAQRKKDEKLAVCLQQGGHYQMEGIVKQEVVTPTMAQPTSLFSNFFDSLATQGIESQPSGTYRSSGQRENGFNSNAMFPAKYTNTIPQFTGSQSVPGGTSRRQQGGPRKAQNDHLQFARQEDRNMNFLNSLSNGKVSTNNLNMSNNLSSNQLPTQQSMQRTIRDILQTTNNTVMNQTTNRNPQVITNLPSQQNAYMMPQQNVTALPQRAPINNQRNVFNTMRMNPMMNLCEFQETNQLDSVIQSLQQEDSSYQSLNGANMPSINQLNQTFDFSSNL